MSYITDRIKIYKATGNGWDGLKAWLAKRSYPDPARYSQKPDYYSDDLVPYTDGTWDEVRDCRDIGLLTDDEYMQIVKMADTFRQPPTPKKSFEKYSEDEPRVPAGGPGGGEWGDGSGTSASSLPMKPEDFSGVVNAFPADLSMEKMSSYIGSKYSEESAKATGLALASGLKDNEAWKQLVRESTTHGDPFIVDARNADGVAKDLVLTWTSTSGDHDNTALALQAAAAKEFNLTGTRSYPLADKAFAESSPGQRAGYQAFVREMYNQTQADLAAHGIKDVYVLRGSTTEYKGDPAVKDLSMNPMTSFSVDVDAASHFTNNFGRPIGGTMTVTKIPASRILSTGRTGFGTHYEREVVVLGGKTEGVRMLGSRAGWQVDARNALHGRKAYKADEGTVDIDSTLDDQDWVKQSWNLPPYKSPEFMRIIHNDLENFRTLPVYKNAVKNGVIVNDLWVGPRKNLPGIVYLATKYSDSEPRDDHGRWTTGGGSEPGSAPPPPPRADIGRDPSKWGPLSPSVVGNSGQFAGTIVDATTIKGKDKQAVYDQINKMEDKIDADYKAGTIDDHTAGVAQHAIGFVREALNPGFSDTTDSKQKNVGFIAMQDGKISGGALLNPLLSEERDVPRGTAELVLLGSFQRGAGSALLHEAENYARSHGAKSIGLVSSDYAKTFYAHEGYVPNSHAHPAGGNFDFLKTFPGSHSIAPPTVPADHNALDPVGVLTVNQDMMDAHPEIKSARALKYSDEEARDDHGRWTSGGAAGEHDEKSLLDLRKYLSEKYNIGVHVEDGVKEDRARQLLAETTTVIDGLSGHSTQAAEALRGLHIEMLAGKSIPSNLHEGARALGVYNKGGAFPELRIAAGLPLQAQQSLPRYGQFTVGSDFRSVISHELGHAISGKVALAYSKATGGRSLVDFYESKPRAYWAKTISAYGSTKPKELFAEAVSAYMNRRYLSSKGLPPEMKTYMGYSGLTK